MPPKRGAKAAPSAAPAKAASASGAAAASGAAPAGGAGSSAELLKECDKALHGVRTVRGKKSYKLVADLLAKQPCSLTFRTQCAAYLISALVEPASALTQLTAACATSSMGVSAEPSCLHLEVMHATVYVRRAFALGCSLAKLEGSNLARLERECKEASDQAQTLLAKLDNAAFSTASLDVLEQEKRMAQTNPDQCSALQYRGELKERMARCEHGSCCAAPSSAHAASRSQAQRVCLERRASYGDPRRTERSPGVRRQVRQADQDGQG